MDSSDGYNPGLVLVNSRPELTSLLGSTLTMLCFPLSRDLRFGLPVHHPSTLRTVAPTRATHALLFLSVVIIVFVNFHLPRRRLIRLSPLVPSRLVQGQPMMVWWWRLLLLQHRWQCGWVVSCFRWMIILISPSLILVSDFRWIALVAQRWRRLTSTWRAKTSSRWRLLPVRRRRSTVPMIFEPATGVVVGGVLVHYLVVIIRIVRPLESGHWSLLAISCGRFSSSKRLSWRRGTSCQNAWLGRVWVMLILWLVSVMWTW